jgi:hypothetical protein
MRNSVLFVKLSASIFKVPENEEAREYYRGSLRHFFEILRHHAVIFIDDQGILSTSYKTALDLMSGEEKTLIKSFLKQMQKERRFIKVGLSIPSNSSSCCEVMNSIDGKMFCSSRNCQLRDEVLRNSSNLADQNLSSWQNAIKIYRTGTVTQSEAFRCIFDPILKYTKNLQIYDKNIGAYLQKEGERKYRVNDNYQRGIISILERFNKVSIQEKISVEIYTTHGKSTEINSKKALEEFESFLAEKFSTRISIEVFGVRGMKEDFAHCRGIKSDQFTFYIEHGCDWIDENHKVRDNMFSAYFEEFDTSKSEFSKMRGMQKYYPEY